jgi:quercetin dioxygenase-like cupin family protein
MSEIMQHPDSFSTPLKVAAGKDRFNEYHPLGISAIDFKITKSESADIFIIENTFRAKGGPARHLHYEQEEWFYAVEGEFHFEVGEEKLKLNSGDSLLAPRKVPHVWAFTGETRGKMLIAFFPAGKMEAFFQEVAKTDAMPALDPAFWRAYGMELLGPPLPVS